MTVADATFAVGEDVSLDGLRLTTRLAPYLLQRGYANVYSVRCTSGSRYVGFDSKGLARQDKQTVVNYLPKGNWTVLPPSGGSKPLLSGKLNFYPTQVVSIVGILLIATWVIYTQF